MYYISQMAAAFLPFRISWRGYKQGLWYEMIYFQDQSELASIRFRQAFAESSGIRGFSEILRLKKITHLAIAVTSATANVCLIFIVMNLKNSRISNLMLYIYTYIYMKMISCLLRKNTLTAYL